MTQQQKSAQPQGIVINSKSISLATGIIGLLIIFYTTITTINSYTFRIDQLEQQNANLITQITSLNVKIDKLTDELNRLNVSIKVLEATNTKSKSSTSEK